MNKLVRNIYYACFTLMFLLTSCFRDGLDECPPENEYYSYIKFVYDYNMSFEDLFHRQVSKVDVYLFDGNGVFMQKLVDQVPQGSTFSRQYVLGLPEDYKDVVQFVAYAGQYEDQTRASDMIPNLSTINDLQISLNDHMDNMVDHSLEPLWHGNRAFTTRAMISRNDTTVISLVKNTNMVRIVLQSLDKDLNVDVKDFSFELEANNQDCNAFNETTGVDPWKYVPHYTNTDEDAGAIAELHTMRLLSDRENRLVITNKDGSNLLDVNLNKYINAMRLQQYSYMPLQEYMDREDEYGVIVFLTKDKPSGRWMAGQITINSWLVRDKNGIDID